MPQKFTIRTINQKDVDWIKSVYIQYWSGDIIVSRGKIKKINDFTGGYIAEISNVKKGLICYKINNFELEITGLVSLKENMGIGSALVKTVIDLAEKQDIKRICLVTTNDNLKAIGFWQKRGFQLIRVYLNAMEYTRKLKPSIPLIGENGIPLRDELELEMLL
jgi:N-acetylglutamate synthase-like GNAT family acetyltransferase